MAAQVVRKQYNLDEFEQMVRAGILTQEDRVELIEGEIVEMAPIEVPHEACVARLNLLLVERLQRTAVVWPQSSIRIPTKSRPQPDIAVLKWRDDLYGARGAAPEDVVLLIEVAASSLRYDQTRKAPLYAEAGIPELWIVNLQENIVEVYAQPASGVYQSTRRAGRGETLQLPGGLNVTLGVDEILG
jgi:Uma2 family endonuclease